MFFLPGARTKEKRQVKNQGAGNELGAERHGPKKEGPQ